MRGERVLLVFVNSFFQCKFFCRHCRGFPNTATATATFPEAATATLLEVAATTIKTFPETESVAAPPPEATTATTLHYIANNNYSNRNGNLDCFSSNSSSSNPS